jgi:hypothetical protein
VYTRRGNTVCALRRHPCWATWVGLVRRAAACAQAKVHEALVTECALSMLLKRLRGALATGPATPPDDTLAALDPLVEPLVDTLGARSAACVALALRCLAVLAPLPLPAMQAHAAAIGRHVTALLKKAPSPLHPSAQVCIAQIAVSRRYI